MGRNDIGGMGFVRVPGFLKRINLKNIMKRTALYIMVPFFVIALTSAAFVQDTATEYLLKVRYRLNIMNHYSTTETTTVTRTFSDNTKREYKRDVIYFFTLTQLSLPSQEFQEIEVKIDSMKYKFSEGEKEIIANTEDEDFGETVYTEDLSTTVIPNAKSFITTYSPYGDFAKNTSETISQLKDYLAKHSKTSPDTMKRITWENQLSDNHLQYISDIRKILLPINPIKKDSIWKSPIKARLDGKTFVDTVDAWIAHIEVGEIFIEAVSNMPKFLDNYGLFYGIRFPLKIDSTAGRFKYTFSIDPFGNINHTEGLYSARIHARSNNERFTDSVTVTTKTMILGRYKY